MLASRVVALVVMGLFVVGCAQAPESAADVSEAYLQAVAVGDNETWRQLHAEDVTVTLPDGETIALFGPFAPVLDDYDEDGVRSIADDLQARQALHEPADQSMSWERTVIDETTVECTVTTTDAFLDRAGTGPLVSAQRMTIRDGVVVAIEWLEPPDPEAFAAANAGYGTELDKYEQWVSDAHPDAYAQAFHGPCCGSQMVQTQDGVAAHAELMPEYFARD